MKLKISNKVFIDRREGREPVPSNCLAYFNLTQLNTYFDLRKIGWKLFFIRRPRLREPTIAMINSVGTRAAVINPDGSFDFHSSTIKMRLQKKA